MASIPTPAAAHGATMMPGSRTYLCYLDLIANSGTQMPANPACAAAVRQGGTGPLYNWFAVLDSNAGGRTTGYIPDGTLCSGGNRGPFNFAAYNAARSDWPKTHLTSGANIELRHSNWAHHPGRFDVYITKNGWSPSRAVGWGDLERISSVTNPPQRGGVGSEGGHYYWNVQLPNRSGQHLMFVHWIRSDSQENFFSCSDIVFDGGNGQVTYGDGQTLSAEQIAEADEAARASAASTAHAGHDAHQAHAGHAGHDAHAGHAGSEHARAGAGYWDHVTAALRDVHADLFSRLS
ncbi:lytic polysaccharide monooxygenase auxiliary activity family 9 protein [Streptomyces marincola]|uniref:lytic polysaccharide monooxygenase auxiliary activity family 9 protein n=1 Tax=Streptomyces marincola TaxID=2878388 RepID=UPI001CF3B0AD|nr:lytic polysaccharide monooxygenase [Streptomyces marincola]UCM91845.1 lytic polysaccharide monooxygenase [Streptomyces marincola]